MTASARIRARGVKPCRRTAAGEAIRSAGGYLRGLTDKATAGQFSAGSMLMALIGIRERAARERAST